jgi:murein DD-endopeptidase MepM/ murein hydrolase activator NlpD
VFVEVLMQALIEKLKESLKKVSFKRVFILSGFMLFAIAIVFASIFLSTSESIAYSPVKPQTFKEIIKDKKQNIEAVYKDSYLELSKRDKDLAYIYLKKKFKGKNVTCTLYKVQPGENFWGVAKKYNVNIDTIIGANPELEDLKATLNKQIIIPSAKGVIHEVTAGMESIKQLAEIYKVTEADIKNNNNLFWNSTVKGDLLFIPEAKPVFIGEYLKTLYEKRKMFRSPLAGRYTSLMGYRIHPVTGERALHQGVDIKAEMGSWVGASADGKVIFAGWGGNLGYAVKIAHKEGYMTVYGHLSKILVHEGQNVFAGKLIAKSGNSGRVTGPHLHFALYKDGKLQDPLKYLW